MTDKKVMVNAKVIREDDKMREVKNVKAGIREANKVYVSDGSVHGQSRLS